MTIRSQAVALAAAGIITLGLASPAFAKQKHAQMQAPGQTSQMMSGNPSQMQGWGQSPQMMPGNPSQMRGSGQTPQMMSGNPSQMQGSGFNGSSRPPGWSHGAKRGWGGHN